MAFKLKEWKNGIGGGTPLSAAAMIDLEERLSGYTNLATSFINVATYGAKGNGSTDDTTAIQNAINAAITANLPLFIPPGTYVTSSELLWNAENVAIFGSGSRTSLISPTGSTYNALKVGTSEGGQGGYIRDIGFVGGDEASVERTKAGVKSTTGKGALVINGQRLLSVYDVYVSGCYDIGIDLINNSYGCNFFNLRVDFNAVRVGVNLREGGESGSDLCFYGCWIAGEVAAYHIAGNGGGYHFFGGQVSSNNQATVQNDERGSVIVGKDYTSQTKSGPFNISFDGLDFEGASYCWLVRSFSECSMNFTDCGLNMNGTSEFGVLKLTGALQAQVTMSQCRVGGECTKPTSEIVTIEDDGSAFSWFETNTSGSFTANSVDENIAGETLTQLCQIEQGHAMAAQHWIHNNIMFRRNGTAFEKSTNFGSTWALV